MMLLDMTLRDWADLATIVTAATAVTAFFGVWYQLRSQRFNQREATATEVFTDFLKEALLHPTFIEPQPQDVDPEAQTFRNSHEEFLKYHFYLKIMLTAFELIHALISPRDDWGRSWHDTMKSHLKCHLPYLRSSYFWGLEKNSSRKFAAFIRSSIQEDGLKRAGANATSRGAG